MAVELSPRPLLMVLKSMLTVIGFSIELSILAIAALIPLSMANLFALLVIELSKRGIDRDVRRIQARASSQESRSRQRNEGQDSPSADDGCCY